MKKLKNVLKVFATLSLGMFMACTSDYNSTTDYTGYCALTNVTLGSLNCTRHTTSSTGKDSTYIVTLTGSYYPMYIDQINGLVYNTDSLPLGTDNAHVLFKTIASEGVVAIKSLVNGQDSAISISSSSSTTDSLDFSQPRTLIVYATDGSAKKMYQVNVNVHKENGYDFPWQQIGSNTDIATFNEQHAIYANNQLYVFGTNNQTSLVVCSTNGKDWDKHEIEGVTKFQPRSVQFWKNRFYAIDNQRLIVSNNGINWSNAETTLLFDQLLTSTETTLYAISGDNFYSSTDASNWNVDNKDTENKMPKDIVSGVSTPSKTYHNLYDILVAGYDNNGTSIWFNQSSNKSENNWIYFPETEENKFNLPKLNSMQLLEYNNHLLAVGCNADTLTHFYVSADYGRTWKADSTYKIPTKARLSNNFSCTKDKDNNIWFFCGGTGTVWKGRLKLMGWKKEQTSFERTIIQ